MIYPIQLFVNYRSTLYTTQLWNFQSKLFSGIAEKRTETTHRIGWQPFQNLSHFTIYSEYSEKMTFPRDRYEHTTATVYNRVAPRLPIFHPSCFLLAQPKLLTKYLHTLMCVDIAAAALRTGNRAVAGFQTPPAVILTENVWIPSPNVLWC